MIQVFGQILYRIQEESKYADKPTDLKMPILSKDRSGDEVSLSNHNIQQEVPF